MAGILLQGLRRAIEKEGVKIHFIKVKGHMDQHKGFLETFRCAKGNKLADEYATKGMQAETVAMPYRMEEVPYPFIGIIAGARDDLGEEREATKGSARGGRVWGRRRPRRVPLRSRAGYEAFRPGGASQ